MIDRYTKLVLTVIALALLANVMQMAVRPSSAEGPTAVWITGINPGVVVPVGLDTVKGNVPVIIQGTAHSIPVHSGQQ